MFSTFANSLTTDLNTTIPASLNNLVTLIAAVAGLGWGLHFLRKFGIIKRA